MTQKRVTLDGRIQLSGPHPEPAEGPRRYDTTIMQAGETLTGYIFPPAVLADATHLFHGAPCQIDHHWDMPHLDRAAGSFGDVTFHDGAIRATLSLWPTPAGDLLARIFTAWLQDRAQGAPVSDVGLSAVLWCDFSDRTATAIRMVESVDAVFFPVAGGRVERVLNSLSGGHTVPEQPTNQPVIPDQDNPSPLQDPPAPPEISMADALAAIARVSDRVEALTSNVERLSLALAARQTTQTVTGMGTAPRDPSHIRFGRSSMEQIEQALEALIAGRNPPSGIQPLTGIRELYMLLSGDYEMTGRFNADRIYLANVTSATMAALVANALNKVVVQAFQEYPRWWEPFCTEVDFSTLQDTRWITLGGIGELPTVAEGATYTELTWDDKTETAAFVKKGGYLGITIEAIDKDDTRKLRLAPMALAQAAWLTLSKAVSYIFTQSSGVGPTLADSIALFNASHSNLGSTALSHAAWAATRTAMRKQTELNSGERLGALVAPKFLLVPPDLEMTALQIMATEMVPGASNFNENIFAEGNEHMARLSGARDRVIVVDLWTDTNDWAAIADPRLYPSIAIGYRYGRTPEIFSVASPTAGLMFSNDVMPVKVRFFYATGPVDYRGMYKHNV